METKQDMKATHAPVNTGSNAAAARLKAATEDTFDKTSSARLILKMDNS
jgi:hypothetical protein